jgi:hypothetical protein
VNPALLAIAAATVAGAVLAVSARDVRATVLGLLVVLLAAPLIADPWPGPLSILARIAAALLAIRLLLIGLRGDAVTSGSRIGWPAEALVAAAAGVVGFGSHGLGAVGLGPAEAQAAGFALIALAAGPLFTGRDALRLAVGALLLLVAATLVRAGLDAPPPEAEQLVGALLTIAIGGAIAVIVAAARAAGGLDVVDGDVPGEASRRLPDAHRPTARETGATVGPAATRPAARPGAGAGPGGRPRTTAGPKPALGGRPTGPARPAPRLDTPGARRPTAAQPPAGPPPDRDATS